MTFKVFFNQMEIIKHFFDVYQAYKFTSKKYLCQKWKVFRKNLCESNFEIRIC